MLTKIKITEMRVWKEFKVPSKTEKNSYHIVNVMYDGKMFCDCVAGQYNRDCSHKKMAKLEMSGFTQYAKQ